MQSRKIPRIIYCMISMMLIGFSFFYIMSTQGTVEAYARTMGEAHPFAAGDGSLETPFLIKTSEQLEAVGGESYVDAGYYFQLEKNLELSGRSLFDILFRRKGDTPWVPIGTAEKPFIGVFDGNAKTIQNVQVIDWGESGAGLFGAVSGENSSVGNLILKDGDISTSGSAGSVAGVVDGASLSNIKVVDTVVYGEAYAGGLVGILSGGVVRECLVQGENKGSVNANAAGGLVGLVTADDQKTSIGGCMSDQFVSASKIGGGLIGVNQQNGLTISSSYSKGTIMVNTQHPVAGGLIGETAAVAVSDSYTLSPVAQIAVNTGGAVGKFSSDDAVKDTAFSECYWSTADSGQYRALPQGNFSGIRQPLSEGVRILSLEEQVEIPLALGNLKPLSKKIKAEGFESREIAYTVKQDVLTLQAKNQQVNQGALLVPYETVDGEIIQAKLQVAVRPDSALTSGTGTYNDPILIAKAGDFELMRAFPDRFYKIDYSTEYSDASIDPKTKTLDFSGMTSASEAIGTLDAPFRGCLDGNGYTVTGLKQQHIGRSYTGLFGVVDGNRQTGESAMGYIHDLTVKGVRLSGGKNTGAVAGMFSGGVLERIAVESADGADEVTGTQNVGGLVGTLSNSWVKECSVSGLVVSGGGSPEIDAAVGGAFGLVQNQSRVEQVIASKIRIESTDGKAVGGFVGIVENSAVSSSDVVETAVHSQGNFAGGFVGRLTNSDNRQAIEDCFASGTLEAGQTVGGFAGEVNGKLNACYTAVQVKSGEGKTGGFAGTVTATGLRVPVGCYWSSADSGMETAVGDVGMFEGISEPFKNSNVLLYKQGQSVQMADAGLVLVLENGDTLAFSGQAKTVANETEQDVVIEKSGGTMQIKLTQALGDTPVEVHLPYEMKRPNGVTRRLTARFLVVPEEILPVFDETAGVYWIGTQKELQSIALAARVNARTNVFKLKNDIVLTKDFEPIGTLSNPFTGVFDGNGYEIKNLVTGSASQSYTGLFGCVYQSELRNVRIGGSEKNSTQVNGFHFVGLLCGYAVNSEITGCDAFGVVSGGENSGGLVGAISGTTVKQSGARITIETQAEKIGGLVGLATGQSVIESSYSVGKVVGQAHVGGIAGQITEKSMIKTSFSYSMLAAQDMAGGLVGSVQDASLLDCFATQSEVITTGNYGGALFGYISQGTVASCYGAGRAANSLGFAEPEATLTDCYYDKQLVSNVNPGQASYKMVNTAALTRERLSGFGMNWVFTPGYYPQLKSFAGNPYLILATAVPTFYAKDDTSFDHPQRVCNDFVLPVSDRFSWDILAEETENTNRISIDPKTGKVRLIRVNNDAFRAQFMMSYEQDQVVYKKGYTIAIPSSDGSVENPRLIFNSGDLQQISENKIAHYRLAGDIECTQPFEPIGTDLSPFRGSLDGAGYSIRGLRIETAGSPAGLFGVVQGDARYTTVQNLTIEAQRVQGGDNVGVLAGTLIDASVKNAIIRADSVDGNKNVGAVAGLVQGTSRIENVQTRTAVTAKQNGGGLVGRCEGAKIASSVSGGTVQAGENAAGLAGSVKDGTGSVERCYSTASVSTADRGKTAQPLFTGEFRAQEAYWFAQQFTGKGDGVYSGALLSVSEPPDTEDGVYTVELGETKVLTLPVFAGISYTGAAVDENAGFRVELMGTRLAVTGMRPGANGTVRVDYQVAQPAGTEKDMPYSMTMTLSVEIVSPQSTADSDPVVPAIPMPEVPEAPESPDIGTGYLIRSAADFDEMRRNPDGEYVLAVDVALSSQNWEPIGTAEKPFTGSLRGLRSGEALKTITGLICTAETDNAGLFGVIEGGLIQDISIKNASVKGSSNAGILAGKITGGTKISNVCVEGNSLVQGKNNAGGLVGAVQDSEIEASISYATVECESVGGGLIGQMLRSNLTTSYSAGSITAAYENAGGLVGIASNSSSIAQCFARSDVKADTAAGGFIGKVDNSKLKDCFAGGTVALHDDNGPKRDIKYAGGFAGVIEQGNLEGMYTFAKVTPPGFTYKGGFSGKAISGRAVNCHYDREAGGIPDANALGAPPEGIVTGDILTSQLMSVQTDLGKAWDHSDPQRYPELKWFKENMPQISKWSVTP